MREEIFDVATLKRRLQLEQMGGLAFLPLARTQETSTVTRRVQTLDDWEAQARECRACRLSERRRSVVFGEGSAGAALLFVGEAPGMEEDLQARPFVGAAGELLTKIIHALKLTRDQVYIANTVKCRPPQNRTPQPDELQACRRFLDAQLELIKPRIICALGRTAANALLGTDAPLGSLRGTVQMTSKGIPIVATYHPAHLLRHPEAKRDAWADLQQLLPYLTPVR